MNRLNLPLLKLPVYKMLLLCWVRYFTIWLSMVSHKSRIIYFLFTWFYPTEKCMARW